MGSVRQGMFGCNQGRRIQFLDNKGEDAGFFLRGQLMQRCDKFVDHLLEMLIPHKERDLAMLWKELGGA